MSVGAHVYIHSHIVWVWFDWYEGICVCDICLLTGWLPSWPFSLQLWHFPLRHNKGVDFSSLNLSPSSLLLLFLTAAFCNKIHQHHQLLGLLLPSDIFVSLFLSPYLPHRLISVSLFTLCLDLSQPPFLPRLLSVFSSLCLRRDLKYKCCNETATQATAVADICSAHTQTHKPLVLIYDTLQSELRFLISRLCVFEDLLLSTAIQTTDMEVGVSRNCSLTRTHAMRGLSQSWGSRNPLETPTAFWETLLPY